MLAVPYLFVNAVLRNSVTMLCPIGTLIALYNQCLLLLLVSLLEFLATAFSMRL